MEETVSGVSDEEQLPAQLRVGVVTWSAEAQVSLVTLRSEFMESALC